MPFVSKAQERWAFATKQPFAQQWAQMTDQKALPRRVKPPKQKLAEALAKKGQR